MQDRYKYRAKRLDNNEWYYGSYLYLHNADKFDWNGVRHSTNEDVHYIIDENDVNYAINPETICQCTGIKDKNGKLIYEGDIVQILDDEIPYVVEYEQDRAMFIIHSKIDRVCCNFDNYSGYELETIDDIYENTELIKN